MIVEVAPLPGCLVGIERKVAVVVDALRASSTVVAMFEAGARAVHVAGSPADAFRLAAVDRERYLLCGEVGGVPPPGFDHGNSPSEIARLSLDSRELVLSTSNGTRALRSVERGIAVYVGTGRNAAAVAAAALDQAEAASADLVVVCAGDEQGSQFSLEDFFFAGLLVERLSERRSFSWPVDESEPRNGDPSCWVLDESALAARRVYRSYLANGVSAQDPDVAHAMFGEARNGCTLPRIGYGVDLNYCGAVDVSSVVPRLTRRGEHLLLVAER